MKFSKPLDPEIKEKLIESIPDPDPEFVASLPDWLQDRVADEFALAYMLHKAIDQQSAPEVFNFNPQIESGQWGQILFEFITKIDNPETMRNLLQTIWLTAQVATMNSTINIYQAAAMGFEYVAQNAAHVLTTPAAISYIAAEIGAQLAADEENQELGENEDEQQ